MRIAVLVLGILGGVIGLFTALGVMAVGGFAAAVSGASLNTLTTRSLIVFGCAVLGLIGGAVALRYPNQSAGLLLVAGIGGFVSVQRVWFLARALCCLGGILAFVSTFVDGYTGIDR